MGMFNYSTQWLGAYTEIHTHRIPIHIFIYVIENLDVYKLRCTKAL